MHESTSVFIIFLKFVNCFYWYLFCIYTTCWLLSPKLPIYLHQGSQIWWEIHAKKKRKYFQLFLIFYTDTSIQLEGLFIIFFRGIRTKRNRIINKFLHDARFYLRALPTYRSELQIYIYFDMHVGSAVSKETYWTLDCLI